MNVFEWIREKNTPKIRRIVYLVIACWATFFGLILLFVPFCTLFFEEDIRVTPYTGISMLKNQEAVADGGAYFGVALLALWVVYMIFSVRNLVRLAVRVGDSDEAQRKRTQQICLLHTIVTGVYFLSSQAFCFINNTMGGGSATESNAWPFVLLVIADLLFALYIGVWWEDKSGEKTEEKDARRATLTKKRIEMFVYTTLLVVCAVLTCTTKIISVSLLDESAGAGLKEYDFSMRGIEILKNYQELERGGQILAFLLFLSLTVVLTFYLLSVLSALSRSRVFFRFALGSIIASCVGCFFIGMYGKYYEIIQSVNVDAMINWMKFKLNSYGMDSVSLDYLKEQFLESYEVKSTAFYYFLGAVAVAGVCLVSRPYSKGLALVQELEGALTSVTANIQNAEMQLPEQGNGDDYVPAPAILTENGLTAPALADPCAAFSELDEVLGGVLAGVERRKATYGFVEPTLPKLVQFIVQYARDSRLHLFYTEEDIAAFIAGLGSTKLTILQGMSGTGKTSLPKIFCEALLANCNIIEVESSWRDKNELLGYYNEFSKAYTPKKFTQALYAASLNPQTLTFIVLDEMNLSRIEYYFSDFLSLMENEPDKREIKLLNVSLYKNIQGKKVPYKGLRRGHTIKISPNVWFVGTANRDESTFEISDKVYDRAHTMNFNKRAKKVRCYNQPLAQRFLTADEFNRLLEEAKGKMNFSIEEYPVIAEVEKLLAPYNISFGNRIAKQIETFVAIYCACFTPTEEVVHDAVERILLTKVVAKLELKSVEGKEELAAAFEGLGLSRCSEFISKLNED